MYFRHKKQLSKNETQYDLFDFHDNFIQVGTKRDAKKLKLFTRSAHIILVDTQGKLMICKRPPSKKTYPNQITSSAGGHVEKGENYKVAAKRELKEELGLVIPIKDAGRFDVINNKERAIHHLFIGKTKNRMLIDSSEISNYYFLSLRDIKNDITLHPRKYAMPFHGAFDLYLKTINPPIILLDFDHTIFDWYGFKKDFWKYLKNNLEISEKEYLEAKDRAEEKKLYNFKTHLREITKHSKVSYFTLSLKSNMFCKKLPNYIFPDAMVFLQKMSKTGDVVLLTYGDKWNQEFFIKGTGINKYCKKVIITSTKKEKRYWIKKYIKTKVNQKIMFVNDDPKETKQVLKGIDSFLCKIVLVERPTAKYFPIPKDKIYLVTRKLSNII